MTEREIVIGVLTEMLLMPSMYFLSRERKDNKFKLFILMVKELIHSEIAATLINGPLGPKDWQELLQISERAARQYKLCR